MVKSKGEPETEEGDSSTLSSDEVLELLADETRISILKTLWDLKEPYPQGSEPVSFSRLIDAVGHQDPGTFNYHLGKLVGVYVEKNEDGYELSPMGNHVIHNLIAGTISDYKSVDQTPVDRSCHVCGSNDVIMEYETGRLYVKCTSCEGGYPDSDFPSGMLEAVGLPPAGLEGRTPNEIHEVDHKWAYFRWSSRFAGVCPVCSGQDTGTVMVCENHDSGERACDNCGSSHKIRVLRTCTVCKSWTLMPSWVAPIYGSLKVASFYDDHGIDVRSRSANTLGHTIEEESVVSEAPLEVLVMINIDGDRLEVLLDDEGDVIKVRENV
ncbi:MAG: helix-turn-helix domain-containing protein [Halobacteria archaeon]|nr:helix-turn-helix domain-containing protein [Halobacteria archaeon]